MAKTNKLTKNEMETKKNELIYINQSQIQTDKVIILNDLLPHIEVAAAILEAEKINTLNVLEVLTGNYSNVINDYKAGEQNKLEAAKALLGEGLILEIAGEKINRDCDALVEKLKTQIRVIDWQMHKYFEFFVFENDTWKLRKDFEKAIELKNSIILNDPLQIQTYKKHKKLVDLINELNEGSNNINRLLRWSDGHFIVNIKLYDKNQVAPSYF